MFRKGVFITVALAVVISLVAVVFVSAVSIRKTYDGMMQDFSRQVNSALAQAAENELFLRTDKGNCIIFGSDDEVFTIPKNLPSMDISEIKTVSIYKFINKDYISRILSDAGPTLDSLTGFNILAFRLFLSQAMESSGIDRPYAIRFVRQAEKNMEIVAPGDSGLSIAGDSAPDIAGNLEPDTVRDTGPDNTGNPGLNIARNPEVSIVGDSGLSIAGIPEPGITEAPAPHANDTVFAESCTVNDSMTFSCNIQSVVPPMKCEMLIENPHRDFLARMSGVIAAVSVAVLLLSISFIYLVLTIFRQKTLEQMRKDFTHNVTHELKTPVAAACAVNEALLDYSAGEDPARRREYLHMQRKSLDTLSQMIESILAVSVQESEAFVLRREQCSLRDILSEQYSALAAKYGKSIRIGTDLHDAQTPEHSGGIRFPSGQQFQSGSSRLSTDASEGDILLDADRFHLSHAVFNLLDNAVKYCTEEPHIKVTGRREGRMVTISIQDNGIGIPASERKRIFEKYYRITSGDVQDTRGSGLGLYYCRMVAEKHGGTVKVTPAPGKGSGSVFTIRINA